MSDDTITGLAQHEWSAFKVMGRAQHGTDFSGENEGTATTDTPGVGKTVMTYSYDAAAETAVFKIVEKPEHVPEEVIWFALGASVAHVSGAPAKSM